MNRIKIKPVFCILFLVFISSVSHAQNFIDRGEDFLAPADFNFPTRIHLWDITADDPFIEAENKFKIGLSYNYSSAEKYFDPNGNSIDVKKSYFEFNKGSDQGGYFRKHGAIFTLQYHFNKLNKVVLRLPFTFTEMKSYSSTTDVKPQPDWVKPRGPFQDVEISYTRKLMLTPKFDLYGGATIIFPTSRPKRYLDTPHGGSGGRFANDFNAYVSGRFGKFRVTTGARLLLKYPFTEELFTPRPYGIGYPYLYDTTTISADEMNNFIEANPYESTVKLTTQIFYDFVTDYFFNKIGLTATAHFQYFNSSGDEFDTPIPYEFTRVGGNITPTSFISQLDGGNSGVIRLYLKKSLIPVPESGLNFILGFGSSIFGNNAQQEANLILGINGTF